VEHLPILNSYIGALEVSKEMVFESDRSGGVKPLVVKGLLQKCDAKNHNGRVYPREILEREVKSFQKKIDEGTSGGELDHPDSPVVNYKNLSHVVRKIWWEGDNVMGLVEILNTPSGQIAREIIRSGLQLGVSSRALGTTMQNEDGFDQVNEDLDLVTWDLVSQPSTHQAFLHPINEGFRPQHLDKQQTQYMRVNDLIGDILSLENQDG